MAVAFVALFGSAQSKAAGTSLAVAGSRTLAVGDDLFVAFAGDVGFVAPGTAHTGTATVTWTAPGGVSSPGNVETTLFRGNCTVGGTVTGLTISWTTAITAKAAVAGHYSGCGALRGSSARTGSSLNCDVVVGSDVGTWQTGDLIIGPGGWEGPNGDTLGVAQLGAALGSLLEVAQNGTTGGGAATNISVNLVHGIAVAAGGAGEILRSTNNNSRDWAGGGIAVQPAAAAGADPYPIVGGGYYPTEG